MIFELRILLRNAAQEFAAGGLSAFPALTDVWAPARVATRLRHVIR